MEPGPLGTGSAGWPQLPFGPGNRFALGTVRMGRVQIVISGVGFGLFWSILRWEGLAFSSLLGLGERKQLLLAAVKLEIWQITPIYPVKNPKGQGQSVLQAGG